jgi:hypothetical protein
VEWFKIITKNIAVSPFLVANSQGNAVKIAQEDP